MTLYVHGEMPSKYNQLIMVKQVVLIPSTVIQMIYSVGKKCGKLILPIIRPYSIPVMEIEHVTTW